MHSPKAVPFVCSCFSSWEWSIETNPRAPNTPGHPGAAEVPFGRGNVEGTEPWIRWDVWEVFGLLSGQGAQKQQATTGYPEKLEGGERGELFVPWVGKSKRL